MKNIPLIWKIIGVALLVIIATGFIKPNIAKKLYKKIIGDFTEKEKAYKEQLEQLKTEREKDSIKYIDALRAIDEQYASEIEEAYLKYEWLNNKYRRNAKELDDYRNSGFDGKFELFSNAVIGQDTIQGQ